MHKGSQKWRRPVEIEILGPLAREVHAFGGTDINDDGYNLEAEMYF